MARSRRGAASKGVSLNRLRDRLSAGEIACVYLILGEDAFLRRKAIEALTAAIIDDATEDLGLAYERLDAGESAFPEIIDAARSLPLFLPVSDRPVRMIRVTGFDAKKFDDLDMLREYLEQPVPETCLVFEVLSLDKRLGANRLLLQHAVVVDCTAPTGARDIRRWIEGKSEAMGFAMEPDAVAYLIEMVGSDLQQLDQELLKLALFVGDQQRVGAEDLEALLERSREHSIFELTDALVAGDQQRCVEVLNFLCDDGTEPIALLGMISWIVRQLVIAGDLARQGLPDSELLGQLGGRPDKRRSVLSRARHSTIDDLEGLLVACAEADRAVKVRRGPAARGTLEALCRRVCSTTAVDQAVAHRNRTHR